jgi:hypothetical protein
MPLELLPYGNVELRRGAVIPMYDRDKVNLFVDLAEWFSQPLSLISAVLLTSEAQKRINRRKFHEARTLRDAVWHRVIADYELLLKSGGYSRQKPPTIDTYFYRNHHVTCYVNSLRRKGTSIEKACEAVAREIAKPNVTGEEPLDAQSIRTNIYYRTKDSAVLSSP